MNSSMEESHSNIRPSPRPGVKPGASGLGGRDLTTAPTPPPPLRYEIDLRDSTDTTKCPGKVHSRFEISSFLKLLSVVFPVIRHGSHDTLKAFQPQVLLGNAFEENVFGILLKYLQERQNAFS